MVVEPAPQGVRIPLGLTDLPSHTLFLRPPPEELFHYTSLDGARGIIESKALHLTKLAYLNDRSELIFAIELFRSVVQQLIPSVNEPNRRRILSETADQLSSFERTNICVASLCEDRDLLSQWKSYGRVGRGVALGFSGSALSRLNNLGWAKLFRCVYDPAAHRRIAEELVGILLQSYEIVATNVLANVRERTTRDLIGYFNTTFLTVAPVLKNQHFSEEREWRIVSAPRQVTDPNLRAIVSSARTSQYYLYEFPRNNSGAYDFLSSVVIGPMPDADHISSALSVLCRRNDVMLNTTYFSQIPFRG